MKRFNVLLGLALGLVIALQTSVLFAQGMGFTNRDASDNTPPAESEDERDEPRADAYNGSVGLTYRAGGNQPRVQPRHGFQFQPEAYRPPVEDQNQGHGMLETNFFWMAGLWARNSQQGIPTNGGGGFAQGSFGIGGTKYPGKSFYSERIHLSLEVGFASLRTDPVPGNPMNDMAFLSTWGGIGYMVMTSPQNILNFHFQLGYNYAGLGPEDGASSGDQWMMRGTVMGFFSDAPLRPEFNMQMEYSTRSNGLQWRLNGLGTILSGSGVSLKLGMTVMFRYTPNAQRIAYLSGDVQVMSIRLFDDIMGMFTASVGMEWDTLGYNNNGIVLGVNVTIMGFE